VWDVRQRGKPPVSVTELAFAEKDCWAVAFGAEERSFFAGFDDGMVYMADMRMNSRPPWQHHLIRSSGICSLAYRDGRLLASTVDDQFTLFCLDSAKPSTATLEVKGHPKLRPPEAVDTTTWNARFSPHNKDFLMATSGNGYLDLYKVKSAGGRIGINHITTAAAGTQPIISFDWNQSKEGLFAFTTLSEELHVGFVPNPFN